MNKRLIAIILTIACVFGSKAQVNFELEYTTEFQTNFGRNYNWVNLLELSLEIPSETISRRWSNGTFQIQGMSAFHLFEDRVINDVMNYSNILAERIPFSFSVFGYQHQWGRFSLFAGVRKASEDYFSKPYMSLFTSSSQGMIPTLSFNFPLPDYPFSAMCLHAEFQITENWFFKTSLYNGVAHSPERNPFRSFIVDPRNDGLFSISQITYSQNRIGRGLYSLGFAAHTSGGIGPSFYANIEQTLFENERREIGLVLQGGFAPFSETTILQTFEGLILYEYQCRSFFAIGGYFRGFLSRDKRDVFGVYFNAANFVETRERSLEITWNYQLREWLAIQPTFHIVRTGNETRNVGMLRFVLSI